MNPFCEIEVIKTDLVGQIFSQASQNNRTISAVVHGFDGSWPDSIKLNNEVRQAGDSAFYSVSSSGLYGFAFADLGPFKFDFCFGTIEVYSLERQNLIQIYPFA